MAVWAKYKYSVDWGNDGYFSQVGDDITDYVISAWWEGGRENPSQLEGRAIAGVAELTLDNSSGIFSSYNSNSDLYGDVKPNRRVKIEMKIGLGDWVTMFCGYLETVTPVPAVVKTQATAVLRAHDVIGLLADKKKVTVEMKTNITTGAAIGVVLDSVGIGAGQRALDTGLSTMGRWWEENETTALDACRRLEDTECGFLRSSKDGKVVFESRAHRLAHTAQATYTNALDGTIRYSKIRQEDALRGLKNIFTAQVRTFDITDEVVLWELAGAPPAITAGATLVLTARFPSKTTPSGYLSVNDWGVVDVFLNTQMDGEGTDISDDFSITLVKSASEMKLTLTNNGAVTGYLVTCLARGSAVIEGDRTDVSNDPALGAASIDDYGELPYTLPEAFIETVTEAKMFCDHLVQVYCQPIPAVVLELIANKNLATLTDAQVRDISEIVHIHADEESGLYLDGDFFIERTRHDVLMRYPAGLETVHKVTHTCVAVSQHDWSESSSSYTPEVVPSPTVEVEKVPDDLETNWITKGLWILFGCVALKWNENISEGEFRAKYFAPGVKGENDFEDLRTVAEGGTFAHNGTTQFIVTGLPADWAGCSTDITSADPGRWFFAFRLKNADGWSVWSDGNDTPSHVVDWCDTEDPNMAPAGPPEDWTVAVQPAPGGGHAVVVSAPRPAVNGKKIWGVVFQIKDATTGAWRDLDAAAGAAHTDYDGSAIGHTLSGSRLTRESGSGFGTAEKGDLILVDRRGGQWSLDHCCWATVNVVGSNYIDYQGRFYLDATTDLRMKIVKPPWQWNSEGYFGDEPGQGIYWDWYAESAEHGDTISPTFTSQPIAVPAGVDLTDIQARVWFDNGYSRSDDDTISGFAGANEGYCILLQFANPLVIDCSLVRGTGKIFIVELTGDTELQLENGVCGQPVVLVAVQDSTGGRAMDYASMVQFGDDVPNGILSVAPSVRDYLGFIYNADAAKYDVVSFVRNYA